MSLLQAFTVLVTVLLFVVRLRCTLAALCLGKRRSLQQGSQAGCDKPAGRSTSQDSALEQLQLFLTDPKYKRDPEIDVDSEEIGYEPML